MRAVRLRRRTSRSRDVRKPDPEPRGPPRRWRTSRRPARRRSTRSPTFLGVPTSRDRQGGVLRDRRRPVRRGDRPRRLRRQRDEARQRDQGDRRAPAGARSRRSGRAAWRRLRLADRRAGRASSSSTSSSPARRTSSPARTGAGWHVRNVNVPRDYTPDVVAEITNAREGDPCPNCGSPVEAAQRDRGRQHLQARHRLHGARSAPMYLGEDGERHPIVMGSYGIGLGRNVACVVEAHHDEKGIAWPAEVAPYPAHLVAIGGEQGPAGHRDRRAPPRHRGGGRPRPRDPVRRPRRVARREVHGRRAPRHAVDPHGQPALAGGRRRRGHEPRHRRALGPLRSRTSRRSSPGGRPAPA